MNPDFYMPTPRRLFRPLGTPEALQELQGALDSFCPKVAPQ